MHTKDRRKIVMLVFSRSSDQQSTKLFYREDVVNEFSRQVQNGELVSIDDKFAHHRSVR